MFQKLVALKDGKISYRELFENSQYVVKKLSKDIQDPQIDTRFYNGNLDEQIFSIPGSSLAAVPPPTASPTVTTPAPPIASPVAPQASAPAVIASGPLKVMLLGMDPAGRLLDKCSFAIFKPGIKPVKGEIRREDILMLGRTNETGSFNSHAKGTDIKPGTYPIKVVREGYKTFLSTIDVRQGAKAGYAILAIRLTSE